MKKTKRLLIEHWHRELTITIEGPAPPVQDSEWDSANATMACSVCGSRWINLIVTPGSGDVPESVECIRRTLEQSGLHLQVSAAGQLRICQRSLEGLKEKR
jgi:hypothetical protein